MGHINTLVKIGLHVSLTFDNTKKIFDVDSSEIELQRLVHRDGVNEYLVNNNKTRLKDKLELIASANIGPTGHHLITQGEADKFVTATDVERRLLIEDALGLNLYKLRRHEAETKLAKTDEKLVEVNRHVDELEPLIKTLSHEVDRLEMMTQREKTLIKMYGEMFFLWNRHVATEGVRLDNELIEQQDKVENLIAKEKELVLVASENQDLTDEEIRLGAKKSAVSKELESVRDKERQLTSELGELSGEIKVTQNRSKAITDELSKLNQLPVDHTVPVSKTSLQALNNEVQSSVSLLSAKQATASFCESYLGNEHALESDVTNQTSLNEHLQSELNKITSESKSLENRQIEKRIKLQSFNDEILKLQTKIATIEAEIKESW